MKSIFKRPLRVCLIMALTLSLTAGCAVFRAYWEWSSDWTWVSEDRVYPKKTVFTIEPEPAKVHSSLDFSSIYYLWDTWTNRSGDAVPDCLYMRFWPSGEVCGGFVSGRMPTAQDANSFVGKHMGFYRMDGADIAVEIYSPDCYVASKGTIYIDSLVFREYSNRRSGGYSHRFSRTNIFARLPLAGMKGQPDWSPTGMLQRVPGRLGKDEADTKTIVP